MPIMMFPRFVAQLVSLLLLAAGAYLLWRWNEGFVYLDMNGAYVRSYGPWWQLVLGLALLVWSFGGGRFVVLMFLKRGTDEPRADRVPGQTIVGPDGTSIHVESFGPEGAPTLILTHGWGLNSTAWWYSKRELAARFRVIVWDLPGLGRSGQPMDRRYSIDRFAEALGAVVEWSGEARVVLVGHSIGGMTTQTLWRARPDLRERIAGLVLVDTTHENPLRTMIGARVWLGLQKPLIEPICWLTVAVWPLAWLSAWHGYINGSNHIVMRLTGFGRHATRGQVDLAARLAAKGSPAVQAKGDLAMFHWRVTDDLPQIAAPVLVLAGDRDIVTLPRANQTIAELIPAAVRSTLVGGGHMAFMENASACDEAISEFAVSAFAARAVA